MKIQLLIPLILLVSLDYCNAQQDTSTNKKNKIYTDNYFNIGSTHFPVAFYNTFLNGGHLTDKLKGNLNNNNRILRTGGESQIKLGVLIHSEKNVDYFYVDLIQLFTFGGKYHQSLFNFIFSGNNDLALIKLNNTAFHYRNFQLLNIGFNKDNYSFGFVLGNVISENNIKFNTSDFIEFHDNYIWNAQISPSLITVPNTNNLVLKNGQVFGIDGKIKQEFNQHLNFEIGVENLGLIHYSNDALFTQIDTNFTFEGFSFDQILNFNETIEDISSSTIKYAELESPINLTPYSIWGITNYEFKKLTYSLSFFYRHNSQFMPRFNLILSKKISSTLSLSGNIAYGGYTQFQWGTKLLCDYKKYNLGIQIMNVTGFLSSWSKSFGLGLNFNLKL